eukprot:3001628-Rhodomonas_salina.2
MLVVGRVRLSSTLFSSPPPLCLVISAAGKCTLCSFVLLSSSVLFNRGMLRPFPRDAGAEAAGGSGM